MKCFNYSARDAKGRATQGTIEAESRAAAIAALRQQGVVPLSLSEGGRPAPAAIPRKLPPLSRRTLLLSLTLIVAVAALLLPRLRRAGAPDATPTALRQPLEGGAPSSPQRISPAGTPDAAPAPTGAPGAAPAPSGAPGALPTAATAATARPQRPKPEYRTFNVKGREIKLSTASIIDLTGTNRPPAEPPPQPLFEREAENRLALYTTPGRSVPPPPPLSDQELEQAAAEALKAEIIIHPDDSPEVVAEKERVALLKEELRHYIAEGGTSHDFFNALAQRQREEAALSHDARTILLELIRADQLEEARALYDEANLFLAEEGLPPVQLPRPLRRRLGLEAAATPAP